MHDKYTVSYSTIKESSAFVSSQVCLFTTSSPRTVNIHIQATPPKCLSSPIICIDNSCAHHFPPPSSESVQSSSSRGSSTSECALVGVIYSSGLGTPERLKKFEEIQQRKTEHGETSLPLQQQYWLSKIVTSPLPSLLTPSTSFPTPS